MSGSNSTGQCKTDSALTFLPPHFLGMILNCLPPPLLPSSFPSPSSSFQYLSDFHLSKSGGKDSVQSLTSPACASDLHPLSRITPDPDGFPPFPHSSVLLRNVPFCSGFRPASPSLSRLLESSLKGNKPSCQPQAHLQHLKYTSSCPASSFDSGLCKSFTTCCQKPGRSPKSFLDNTHSL